MGIENFIAKDNFAKWLGIELLEVSEGKAKAKLEITDNHLNAVNIVQGGVIFSLADLALAAASNSYGTISLLLNANISYFKASDKSTLFAEATEVSNNYKTASYTIKVTNSNNDLIALLQGLVYRKKDKITIE